MDRKPALGARRLAPALLLPMLCIAACGGGSSGGGSSSSWVVGASTPPQDVEASRFLMQASFGPHLFEIGLVKHFGLEGWLDYQAGVQPALHRPVMELWHGQGQDLSQALRVQVWWLRATRAPDQLRQRTAYALSQIFVVSDASSALVNDPIGLAEYYDVLVRGALGNYRDLLEQITLSPAMGRYLSMLKNQKADPAKNLHPDENFAREVMQLFSIGLVMLGPDGSVLLGPDGQPIPTYDQEVVEGLAAAFTGWNWADAANWDAVGSSHAPMVPWAAYHDGEAKVLLQGEIAPAGQDADQDLDAALDALFLHPNAGPFLARRLIQHFVSSNPSPEYVSRVAATFADDGTGERGDLFAVVRAVLMDPEARPLDDTFSDGGRKLREPLLRQAALWRALLVSVPGGVFPPGNSESYYGQAPLRSPSVFNFFTPFFAPAGAIADAGLVAPEFQITTHSWSVSTTNHLYSLIFNNYLGMPNPDPEAALVQIGWLKDLAASPEALLDELDLLLMGGTMPASMGQTLAAHLAAMPPGDGTQRVLDALFLIVASPQCAVLD